jgi:hypothetical protein
MYLTYLLLFVLFIATAIAFLILLHHQTRSCRCGLTLGLFDIRGRLFVWGVEEAVEKRVDLTVEDLIG